MKTSRRTKLIFAVSDGILDDLARLSIIRAAKTYSNVLEEIVLASYESEIDLADPLFVQLKSDNVVTTVRTLNVKREELEKYTPRIFNEKFDREKSHWDAALDSKQYLANFSDLIIYYAMMEYKEHNILYMDSDIVSLQPIIAEDTWVLSMDVGKFNTKYINANFVLIPGGDVSLPVKKRWLTMIDGVYLDSYHHRYDGVGPVPFDKFFNRDKSIRGFEQHVLDPAAMNRISYDEMYKAAKVAVTKKSPIVIDIIHDGPMLNIPRSAIQAALTKFNVEEVEMGLRITHPDVGIMEYVMKFKKKGIKDVHFYE